MRFSDNMSSIKRDQALRVRLFLIVKWVFLTVTLFLDRGKIGFLCALTKVVLFCMYIFCTENQTEKALHQRSMVEFKWKEETYK